MDKTRAKYVQECGNLLRMALPHLVSCEMRLGKDLGNATWHPTKGNITPMPDDEYVVVTTEKGHTYTLLIDGNSLIAIANEIFSSMAHK